MCKKILFLFLIVVFNIDNNVGGNLECITIEEEKVTNNKTTLNVTDSLCNVIRKTTKDYTLTNMQIKAVAKYDTLIERLSVEYKIPKEVFFGIWGAESSFNPKSKSPFGIKCYKNTANKQMLFDDCGDKKCCFEKYRDFEQAVELFCIFFTNQREYIKCTDYDKQYVNFVAIANEGYCTAKDTWVKNTKLSVKKYKKIKNELKRNT